jgi:hypothetical protein
MTISGVSTAQRWSATAIPWPVSQQMIMLRPFPARWGRLVADGRPLSRPKTADGHVATIGLTGDRRLAYRPRAAAWSRAMTRHEITQLNVVRAVASFDHPVMADASRVLVTG